MYNKFALPRRREDTTKSELEVVMTAWMDENNLSLKMYDIVTTKRDVEDAANGSYLFNETF